jgi:hypothetical protein
MAKQNRHTKYCTSQRTNNMYISINDHQMSTKNDKQYARTDKNHAKWVIEVLADCKALHQSTLRKSLIMLRFVSKDLSIKIYP